MALYDGTEDFFQVYTGQTSHFPLYELPENKIKDPARVKALVERFKKTRKNFLPVMLQKGDNDALSVAFDDESDTIEAARLAGMDFIWGIVSSNDVLEQLDVERQARFPSVKQSESPRQPEKQSPEKQSPTTNPKTPSTKRIPSPSKKTPTKKSQGTTRTAPKPPMQSSPPSVASVSVGSGKKQKRCRKPNVFPCKGECILRNHSKTGTPQRCHNPLYGQAATWAEWMVNQSARLQKMNAKRSKYGLGEMKMDDAGYIVNPNVISTGKLKNKFKKRSTESLMRK